ncbi:MotA/TolQ/ExbB proton channel family protein [Pseudorhodoferax sp. Leaf274]|uniref:MotA/TolQ/ExbB proton channel family protein n=1 Tax=Pseudorhodoferax sp. Leaf274 TaxID=1736318 RepID=UPI0007024305|nr:MotA/TolQ/ExbB proton channel family protein [Pseudorhodoferax sp. Leaf274]KQP47590.1 flagellar motor protein MotA [Pseudorhodoferax sp. Leaf274]
MNALDLLTAGDAIHRLVAWLLLAMSVASWVVILYKLWTLRRAGRDVLRGTAAFWQAPALEGAAERVAAFDRGGLLRPLLAATQAPSAGTLAGSGPRGQQLTRLLRGALNQGTQRLQFGQVLLATVGSTAPFVGLLGTVWGIYHALTSISSTGQITISQVAGPVGEALVMTAAGLAVAIPAVLAYNWFGRSIARIEAELEGFAFDLRDLLAPDA